MMKVYILFLGFLFLIVLGVVALSLGEISISFKELFHLLFSPNSSLQSLILHETRIPRVIGAIVVGASLALSGALYQGIIGNPLVSPSILGVLSGASFGAALGMLFNLSILGIEAMCFLFGLLAMGFALILSFAFDGYKSILMLILGGMISSSFFGAGVSVLKILADPYNTLPNIVYWLMGSLRDIQQAPLYFACIILTLSLLSCLYFSKQIDILSLDEESAHSLGVDIKKMRLVFILIATLLASCSVAIGGLIGWVGLIIPHIARFLIGSNHHLMLPFCACFGAGFLLICDTLSRTLTSTEIPIGILTSAFGIPVFILILINRRFNANH